MSEAPPVDPAGMPPTLRQYRQWEAEGRITRPLTDDAIGDTPQRKAKRSTREHQSRVVDHVHQEADIAGHTITHRTRDRDITHGTESGYLQHQRRREAMCPDCWTWRETLYNARTRQRRAMKRAKRAGEASVVSLEARKPVSGTATTPKTQEATQ
jgi:hypothetical protein